MYSFVHLFHFMLAAVWAGTHVAGDYLTWTLEKSADRLERARTIRKLLVAIEMPVAVIVPVLGFGLVGLSDPEVWAYGWLHMKLFALVILIVILALGARRSRLMVAAFEAGDDASAARHWHGYLVMRILGLAAFALVFVAVVFRF